MTDTTTAPAKTELTGLEAAKADAAARDASVINGRRTAKPAAKPTAPKAPARKPATAKTATKPANSKPAPKATATKATAKPATKAEPETKPETPAAKASAEKRAGKQKLARDLVDLVAAKFAGYSEEDKQTVANWLHSLPTGGEGAGHLRYWPANFTRPSQFDWRTPAK
jgi:hypothetical protein